MSYLTNFERSFNEHTLSLVKEYSGDYDATLLINCLLGLLVMPKELMLNAIPDVSLSEIHEWGILPSAIIKSGSRRGRNDPDPHTLRGLVFGLRHSVAHFRIKPVPADGEVEAFEFKNDRGLHCVVPISQLRQFLMLLSDHLRSQ